MWDHFTFPGVGCDIREHFPWHGIPSWDTDCKYTFQQRETAFPKTEREKTPSQHLPPEVRAAQSWRERKIFLRERDRERQREGQFDNKRRVSSKEEGHRRKITESAEAYFSRRGPSSITGVFPREGWAVLQVCFSRRGLSSITGIFLQKRSERYYRYIFPGEGQAVLQVYFSRRGPSGIIGIFFQERDKRYYRYIFPGEGVRSQLKHLFLLLSLGMLRAAASIPWDPLRPPSDPSSVMGSSVAVELRLRAGLDRPRRGSVAALGEGEMSGRLLTLWYISVGWYSWRYWESSL